MVPFVALKYSLVYLLFLGFASFLFILAALMVLLAAIAFSPIICGTNNEKMMINSPQELEEQKV